MCISTPAAVSGALTVALTILVICTLIVFDGKRCRLYFKYESERGKAGEGAACVSV